MEHVGPWTHRLVTPPSPGLAGMNLNWHNTGGGYTFGLVVALDPNSPPPAPYGFLSAENFLDFWSFVDPADVLEQPLQTFPGMVRVYVGDLPSGYEAIETAVAVLEPLTPHAPDSVLVCEPGSPTTSPHSWLA